MIKVRLSFVPPGGGEADYGLTINMPALPREGDCISVMRKNAGAADQDYLGSEDFIVRRVWWQCSYPDDGKAYHEAGKEPVGTAEVCVECEFAIGAYSSPAHRRGAQSKAKYPAKAFEESNY